MKLTILWSALAPYTTDWFRRMAIEQGWKVQLACYTPKLDAPYSKFNVSFCDEFIEASSITAVALEGRVKNFRPDCVLMCSWNFSIYRKLCRRLKRLGIPVVAAMDNQWLGTLKQRLGVIVSRWYLKPAIDTFLVAGDRQAMFAKKLGYQNLMYGFYAADTNRFSRLSSVLNRPANFIVIARLIHQKGIKQLVDGYKLYRKQVENPWGMRIIGTGPLAKILDNVPGLIPCGFVQPSELPQEFEKGRCLVLPSLFEPWGVVIHEAAAAGMPIIASDRCGAITMFVRDGVNGSIISPCADEIAKAMSAISLASFEEIEVMSAYSINLGTLWNSQMLSCYFDCCLRRLIRINESHVPT